MKTSTPTRQAGRPQRFGPLKRLTTGMPLYLQMAESLTERIESGALVPGQRLPPERELSQTLKVNRMTLRQALNRLEAQGLIIRRQGDGTYVAEAKIERQAGKLAPFTKSMQRRGYKPGAKVIVFEQRPAEASLAKELRVRVSEPVYYVHRLRLINQEPVMLENFTLPVSRFPGLERFDLTKRSAYEIMETEYGVSVSRARQSLQPTIATEYEAEMLKIKQGAPLMLETRLAFDQNDQPVEYGRDLYRGDRFRFVTEIAPLEF